MYAMHGKFKLKVTKNQQKNVRTLVIQGAFCSLLSRQLKRFFFAAFPADAITSPVLVV